MEESCGCGSGSGCNEAVVVVVVDEDCGEERSGRCVVGLEIPLYQVDCLGGGWAELGGC
jgi:hypothetical protein